VSRSNNLLHLRPYHPRATYNLRKTLGSSSTHHQNYISNTTHPMSSLLEISIDTGLSFCPSTSIFFYCGVSSNTARSNISDTVSVPIYTHISLPYLHLPTNLSISISSPSPIPNTIHLPTASLHPHARPRILRNPPPNPKSSSKRNTLGAKKRWYISSGSALPFQLHP
jgi:hypothetical protein